MATIGSFTRDESGVYTGTIRTLSRRRWNAGSGQTCGGHWRSAANG